MTLVQKKTWHILEVFSKTSPKSIFFQF